MNWLIYLDDIEVEEPIGFDSLEISIKRDDKLHGMTFEATTSPLEFFGRAYDYLEEVYESEGVKANVRFRALGTCDTYDYEEVITGRLNFAKRKASCGDVCTVSLPLEEDSCQVVLRSRYDQKIDLDKETAVNGITALPGYNGLAQEIELPAHELKTGTEGYVLDEGDVVDVSIFANYQGDPAIRATYGRALDESLQTSQLQPSVFASSDNGLNDPVLSPVVLLEGELSNCYDGSFNYEARLKGSFDFDYVSAGGAPNPGTTFFFFKAVLGRGEWNEFPPPDPQTGDWDKGLTIIASADVNPTVVGDSWTGNFDITFPPGTVNLADGEGLYVYLCWEALGPVTDIKMVGYIRFDKETYVKVQGVRSCEATTAELYMIHEAMSRVAESITNGCVKVKSSYYGRTDSQPYSFDEDGCGGLRSVTSGLKIRKADDDKFFASLKDLIEGSNGIDNIGVGFEGDIMRVEAVDYFYQDKEILRHDGIPKAIEETETDKFYSKIQVGYRKWEVENVNGLDEFNSNREYNTSLDTLNNPLDAQSGFVAGSYPIEITRQQSFAATGAADTKYDNEIFIICMRRSSYPYGNIEVELGNVTGASNIFSPTTIYNYRISPVRNLLRWYKTIAAGFKIIAASANKLFFSSGTGNLQASGTMTDTTCRLENGELKENQNLFITNFESDDYLPIWENETIAYDYAMSVKDYRDIKANPYGFISAQCGNGEFIKYWIREIKYRPAKGMATFILRKKYGV